MIYEYRCQGDCGRRFEIVRTVANRNRVAKCCGVRPEMVFTAPSIVKHFSEYRAIGGDRRYIRTRQEHKNFLREFGYEEVGNDASFAPPADDPVADAAKTAEMNASLAQLTHTQELDAS